MSPRRLICLIAAALVTLMLSMALASAATKTEYGGYLAGDTDTGIRFVVERDGGSKRIVNIAVFTKVTCEGAGQGMLMLKLKRGLPVSPTGRFAGKLTVVHLPIRLGESARRGVTPVNGRAWFGGQLRPGGKARGRLAIRFDFRKGAGRQRGGGPVRQCFLGEVPWRAEAGFKF